MAKVPKRISERLRRETTRFQQVLTEAKDRDVNESDTVIIVTDILTYIFGFDKYSEITSELAIRGTYCDLAIKIDDAIKFLIEVKAIGLTLKENHLRQAVNYGANHGISWVVLTNGVQWEIYKLRFEQPIATDLVCSLDLLSLNPRKNQDLEQLYLLCKEALSKELIEEYHHHVQAANRFTLGALIQSDSVLNVLKRELKRTAPSLKIDTDEIKALLYEVLKRDLIEGAEAKRARARIQRAAKRSLRKSKKESDQQE